MHTYCAGLRAVPRGAFFCPDCRRARAEVGRAGRSSRRAAASAAGEPAGASLITVDFSLLASNRVMVMYLVHVSLVHARVPVNPCPSVPTKRSSLHAVCRRLPTSSQRTCKETPRRGGG